jgi:hypothetical protein
VKEKNLLRIFFTAIIIEGFISALWLLLIPGNPQNVWWLGLSKSRALILAAILFVLGICIYLTIRAYTDIQWVQASSQHIQQLANRPQSLTVGAIVVGAGMIIGGYFLLLSLITTDLFIQAYLQRFAPIVFWGTAISIKIFTLISVHQARSWKDALIRKRRQILYILLVLFISAVVFKVSTYRITRWDKLPDAAYGIIEGRPHWRAYSNRLLGPYSVYFISQLGGISFEKSLEIFYFLLLSAQNLILFSLISSDTRHSYQKGLEYTIYHSFLFISMQDYYSYTWDYIDLLVFTLFAWGILKNKSTIYFVFLFFIELSNREIAILIAFYLMLDSFRLFEGILESRPKIQLTPIDRTKFFIGSGLLVAGAAYIKIIRDVLFIESSLGHVGDDVEHLLIGNHFQLWDNIRSLFIDNFSSMNFINSLFIFAILVYFLAVLPKFDQRLFKTFIILLSILVSILVFGLINETRMFILTIPFLLLMQLELGNRKNELT